MNSTNSFKLITLLLINFPVFTSYAQLDFTISNIKHEDSTILHSVVEEDSLSFLTLASVYISNSETRLHLNRYNKQNDALESSQILTVPNAPNKILNYEGIKKLGTNYFLFYRHF